METTHYFFDVPPPESSSFCTVILNSTDFIDLYIVKSQNQLLFIDGYDTEYSEYEFIKIKNLEYEYKAENKPFFVYLKSSYWLYENKSINGTLTIQGECSKYSYLKTNWSLIVICISFLVCCLICCCVPLVLAIFILLCTCKTKKPSNKMKGKKGEEGAQQLQNQQVNNQVGGALILKPGTQTTIMTNQGPVIVQNPTQFLQQVVMTTNGPALQQVVQQVAEASKEVIENGIKQISQQVITDGSKEVTKSIVESGSKAVTDSIAEIATKTGTEVVKDVSKDVVSDITKDVAQEVVKESVKDAGTEVVKETGKAIVETVSDPSLVKDIGSAIGEIATGTTVGILQPGMLPDVKI